MPRSEKSARVVLVTLSWNGAELTEQCLNSLERQSFKDFHMTLIDNGSTDRTRELPERYADSLSITYIANETNLGYARGNNIGIRDALKRTPDYIVLLNNDTKPEEVWLERLVAYMDKHLEIGLSQGLNYTHKNENGEYIYDSNGIYLEEGFIPRQRSSGTRDLDNTTPVLGPNAAGAIFRRQLIENICYKGAFFDESFFAYVEDVDMLFRTFWMGWNSGFVDDAMLQHTGSVSGNRVPVKKMYWGARNNIRLITKNVPASILKTKARIIIRSQVANLLYLLRTNRRLFWAYFAGVIVGLIQIPIYMEQRNHILKSRVRDDDMLMKILVPSRPPIGNPFKSLKRKLRRQ